MEKVIVSACLLGKPCRYDGKSCPNQEVIDYVKDKKVYAVCPEQLGGLSTPRTGCEIVAGRVIDTEGVDKTKEYNAGANKVLALAKKENISKAILKSKSPSCGYGEIYDGNFCRKLIKGNGVCAELLINNAIHVVNSEKIHINYKNDDKNIL